MKEWMKNLLADLDYQRENADYLRRKKEWPERSEEEKERLRLDALRGQLRFWINELLRQGKGQLLVKGIPIDEPVLYEFARGYLDLSPRIVDRMHEFLKENDLTFMIKARHGDFDYDELVKNFIATEKRRNRIKKRKEMNNDNTDC